jgi:hypothetical protein
MYYIPQLRISYHENLDCEKSPEDGYLISYPAAWKGSRRHFSRVPCVTGSIFRVAVRRNCSRWWIIGLLPSESDLTFAYRHEEVMPRLRPGISMTTAMIPVFSTAWQLIALDTLPKEQKCNQESFVQIILPSLLNEKNRFWRRKIAMNLSVQINNWMCHNGYRVVNELRRLKILRAPHPPHSPEINPWDFWMFGDFKKNTEGPPSARPGRDFHGISSIVG